MKKGTLCQKCAFLVSDTKYIHKANLVRKTLVNYPCLLIDIFVTLVFPRLSPVAWFFFNLIGGKLKEAVKCRQTFLK